MYEYVVSFYEISIQFDIIAEVSYLLSDVHKRVHSLGEHAVRASQDPADSLHADVQCVPKHKATRA